METKEIHLSIVESKEKVELILDGLKVLRNQVAEIIEKYKTMRQTETENQKKTIACSECGKVVQQDKVITFRDALGNPRSYFHRDCFKNIWISQSWRFDYSAPGFLAKSEMSR